MLPIPRFVASFITMAGLVMCAWLTSGAAQAGGIVWSTGGVSSSHRSVGAPESPVFRQRPGATAQLLSSRGRHAAAAPPAASPRAMPSQRVHARTQLPMRARGPEVIDIRGDGRHGHVYRPGLRRHVLEQDTPGYDGNWGNN